MNRLDRRKFLRTGGLAAGALVVVPKLLAADEVVELPGGLDAMAEKQAPATLEAAAVPAQGTIWYGPAPFVPDWDAEGYISVRRPDGGWGHIALPRGVHRAQWA